MPWKIENVNMVIDNANREGTISQVPFNGSETLYFKGSPLEKTTAFPVGGRYRRVGVNITLGLTPLVGDQAPWIRYFY